MLNYCGVWPIGHKSKRTKGANIRIFLENPQNFSLSGQNGNFDYKFNDHEDVVDIAEFTMAKTYMKTYMKTYNVLPNLIYITINF